ncbi:unnamed protein product [Didymodactylos carnosus]|uniref:Uncharacterized protein n=1 Tax=Didymodactylos carnosus TaxID=1234261 RepID=A0A813WIM0_9BILA|nr:unnamed protein product [Didymodactylos carnosus]CAF1019249.1 unnamed protein product [Didymodactylos carnosus]CAF3643690.1 unnamed protein product [Didymodactylos carnosus]CAF3787953.1 unnamed protein product [Didymodactylos carnosus]
MLLCPFLSACPPPSVIFPCRCALFVLPQTYTLFFDRSEIFLENGKSIVCEYLKDIIDLKELFQNLSSNVSSTPAEKHFDTFYLLNTVQKEIPENVFSDITFTNLQFQQNLHLTYIHPNAFTLTNSYVKIFETLNTNLSNDFPKEYDIFDVLTKFTNIRRISMQNDSLTSIPDYAFRQRANNSNYSIQSSLEQLWFGIEGIASQKFSSIGQYAFYELPNLRFLRLFSDNMTKIQKYSLAFKNRVNSWNLNNQYMEVYLGSKSLSSESFEPTSLTRFRSRHIFLRLYSTAMSYLDENIFQPFLESNSQSAIDIARSFESWSCDCRSSWIQRDYRLENYDIDNRVYGYRCWDYDFKNCTSAIFI